MNLLRGMSTRLASISLYIVFGTYKETRSLTFLCFDTQ